MASPEEQVAHKLSSVMELLQMLLADHREVATQFGACRRDYELIIDEVRILREGMQKQAALLAAHKILEARDNNGTNVDELAQKLLAALKPQPKEEHNNSKWQFWTAIVTLAGTMLAAIASLIMSITSTK